MELARHACLRSRCPRGMWVQIPPGRLWRYAGAWLIGPVLKTVGEKSHEGSNPSTSSKCICSLIGRVRCYERRCDIGSTPIRCTNKFCTYVVVVASDFTKVEAPDRTRIGALKRLLWWRYVAILNFHSNLYALVSRAGEGGGLQNRCRNTNVGPNPTKCSMLH